MSQNVSDEELQAILANCRDEALPLEAAPAEPVKIGFWTYFWMFVFALVMPSRVNWAIFSGIAAARSFKKDNERQ